jgi:hypothetical protein
LLKVKLNTHIFPGPSWSYGSWIYNYPCNQCLSPLTLWVCILLRRGVLDKTLCNKVCQLLVAGLWFPPGTPVCSTKKTDCHDKTEIFLYVALNTKTKTKPIYPNISQVYAKLESNSSIQKLLLWSKNHFFYKNRQCQSMISQYIQTNTHTHTLTLGSQICEAWEYTALARSISPNFLSKSANLVHISL